MVKVISNVPKITKDNEVKGSIFLREVAEEIVRVSEPKTPRKTGALRANVRKQVLGLKGKIVWGQEYAIFQEEKQFTNYTTGGTGPHFAKDAVNEVVAKSQQIARKVGFI